MERRATSPTHSPQSAVAQALLETGQDGLLVSGLHIDDPVGRQPSLSEGGSEQVLAGDAPEHLAAGSERRCRRRTSPKPCRRSRRCPRQPPRAARQGPIPRWEGGDPERPSEGQQTLGRTSASLNLFDRGAQRVEGARGERDSHGLQNRRAIFMFSIRSLWGPGESSPKIGSAVQKPDGRPTETLPRSTTGQSVPTALLWSDLVGWVVGTTIGRRRRPPRKAPCRSRWRRMRRRRSLRLTSKPTDQVWATPCRPWFRKSTCTTNPPW